jgi:DNA replication and repair protein RecF
MDSDKVLFFDLDDTLVKCSGYYYEIEDIILSKFIEYNPIYTLKELKKILTDGYQKEKNLAQCIYGPHRDDFEILLNGMNSRQYCSQGQQRTLALSLILSELHLVEEVRGEKPVLLLDDVMSELDVKRQAYLLSRLTDVQTIITATDELPYNGIKEKEVKRLYVENGAVKPES